MVPCHLGRRKLEGSRRKTGPRNRQVMCDRSDEQLVAEVYARMHGKYCKGISTSMRSDLQLQDVVSSEDKTMD